MISLLICATLLQHLHYMHNVYHSKAEQFSSACGICDFHFSFVYAVLTSITQVRGGNQAARRITHACMQATTARCTGSRSQVRQVSGGPSRVSLD